MEKQYWQSMEESRPDHKPEIHEKEASMIEILANEANEKTASRRDFLKWCGISFFSATVISACENPVKKAIPYLHHPETITPGMASYYASTFEDGNKYCSILVKTRDGRPIKIEGNSLSKFSMGRTSAQVQASVLSLYDDGARYKFPTINGEQTNWQDADTTIQKALTDAASSGKKCYMVTPTIMSATTQMLIEQLVVKYPSLEWVTWDAISYEAIRKSHEISFGTAMVPDYHFDKAELIVSFSADFLGTWVAPVTFAARYAKTRELTDGQNKMSRLIQFEAGMSLTGSNADERNPIKPSDELQILLELYNEMASATGNPVFSSPSTQYKTRDLAKAIIAKKGKTIVVCGHNNLHAQVLVNAINHMAGSYGETIDINQPLNIGKTDKARMNMFVADIEAGNVDVAMFYKVNPLYNHPQASLLEASLAKVPVSVSFATAKDETANACKYVLPNNHYLESWGEVMPKQGHYSLQQPAMQPIFNTRQFQAGILFWLGLTPDYQQFIKEFAISQLMPMQSANTNGEQFWVNILQAGVMEADQTTAVAIPVIFNGMSEAAEGIKKQIIEARDVQFMTYETVTMADGSYANNPWLQELPDPVTKITWDNFAAVSPRFAEEHQINEGDMLLLNNLEVPVVIQPGQAYGCISVALGYGRKEAGKSADGIGANAFSLHTDNAFPWNVENWSKTDAGYEFARTQTHHNMEGREIVRESNLDKYNESPNAGNEIHEYHEKHTGTLYPGHEYDGHHWVLMVDLNKCTGCSTCVIACQAENNVPVIGKKEVLRRRIMHWMRIDRYYSGDIENPSVLYMPLMCQHCDNAPCENVCPVAATNHSHEGINQMAYNRCIGTKYCINNCPYKVRRFNWFRYAMNDKFDYNMNSELGRMVLNPDVTVRERGVVEKCSFCIQRIQAGKLQAKNEGRKLRDGDITPACAGACPSGALVFGDVNDADSRVAKMIKDPRNYHLLEELHTLPTVGYLTRIRNREA